VLAIVLALAPAALAKPAASPAGSGSWADPQIQTVVSAGLMAPTAAEFRPDDPLTRGELDELLAGLGDTVTPGADPSAPVTVADLDAALVKHVGLSGAARQFRAALVAAGLEPPKRAGTEAVARLLGLRTNHSEERLELSPGDPITRAETAFSVARVLGLAGSYDVATVKSQAASFELPALTDWQRRILTRAVDFIGYPYVWAGTSEKPQTLYAGKAPGGFDCSGFVWRVYKLEQYPDAPQLATTLKGRTTYAMSGEVPASLRIPRAELVPADVVFFGDNGTASKPAQVGHMGIYLGNGWFIHSSSSRGVMIAPMTGWYADRFAWGRRPLAEAGLDGGAATAAPSATGSQGADAPEDAAASDPTDPALLGSSD
jgi:cell wall-associated NlpC family hydrolase